VNNKGKVSLEKFVRGQNGSPHVFEYSVEHNNGSTSVEQTLTISASADTFRQGWAATIALDDFPLQDSPHKAADKLADWLERLAAAIRCGEYLDLKKSEFKDIWPVSAKEE